MKQQAVRYASEGEFDQLSPAMRAQGWLVSHTQGNVDGTVSVTWEQPPPPRRSVWGVTGYVVYLILRLLALVLAVIVIGTILGAVVGAFRGDILRAAYNGGFFGFVVGAWMFGLGFLSALVRAARGGFRTKRT